MISSFPVQQTTVGEATAMSEPGEITFLLQEADQGNPDAEQQLFVLVEADLRAIAKKRKRAAQGDVDVSTTMLVNDAFMQLVGQDVTKWEPGDRRKFFGYVSRKMHDLLIVAARREGAAKRGGGRFRVAADNLESPNRISFDDANALLDLQAALERFEHFARDDAILFRLRFFLGCTFTEVATMWDISETAAKESWQRTRAWLQRELKEYGDES